MKDGCSSNGHISNSNANTKMEMSPRRMGILEASGKVEVKEIAITVGCQAIWRETAESQKEVEKDLEDLAKVLAKAMAKDLEVTAKALVKITQKGLEKVENPGPKGDASNAEELISKQIARISAKAAVKA